MIKQAATWIRAQTMAICHSQLKMKQKNETNYSVSVKIQFACKLAGSAIWSVHIEAFVNEKMAQTCPICVDKVDFCLVCFEMFVAVIKEEANETERVGESKSK